MDYNNPQFTAAVKKVLINWVNKAQPEMNDLDANDHQGDANRDVEQAPTSIERRDSAINDAASSSQTNEKPTNWPQRIEAVCAMLLVIITGAYTYYAAGQLHKMKRSTDATERAATAAKSAADTAASTLINAQQQFRIEERPWVSVEPVTPQGKDVFECRQTVCVVQVEILAGNTGKTPALEVSPGEFEFVVGPFMKAMSEAKRFSPKYSQNNGFIASSPMAIGGPHNHPFFTPDEVKKIATMPPEWSLYIVGGITYRDAFSPVIKPYETLYCFHYRPFGFLKWGPCSFGNSIR